MHIVFVPSVFNYNICFQFQTVGDKDFIFGMHTQLIMSFEMTRSMTLSLVLKIAFLNFVAAGGIVLYKHAIFNTVTVMDL